MSYAVDANILLYASDGSSPFHAPALAFLENAASGPELVFLPWPVAMAYLRIATHPSIFEHPLSPVEAQENIEALITRPHVRTLGELDEFWESYLAAVEGMAVRGNLVPDAHIAALLVQHGVTTLCTHDRDFRKFTGIRLRDPLTEASD